MKQIINDDRIEFYDDENNMIMFMDAIPSYYRWVFYTNDIITITRNMELFAPLEDLMNQQYFFDDKALLKNYKEDNYLRWYSDCYYDPDNEFSYKGVSYLNIKKEDDTFKIWCVQPLEEIMERKFHFYVIGFSPCYNGVYSENALTGDCFQDDFVLKIYKVLISKEKSLSKNKINIIK